MHFQEHHILRNQILQLVMFLVFCLRLKSGKVPNCKGFEKENTSLDDLLAFFAKCAEGVVHVNRRTWADRETNTRNFKGSVFVTFKDKASAEKFMALESVKSPAGKSKSFFK